MKNIKILSIIAFVFAVAVFQSCEVDKCDAVICLNDGTCNEGVCECPPGFSGTLCEIEDPCYGVDCQNGGTCVDGTCDCPTGYSGDLCETHCSESILGTWNVTNTTTFCGATSYTLTAGSNDLEINLSVVWDGTAFPAVGTLSEDCSTLTYTETTTANNGVITFNGNMFTDAFNGLNGNCSLEATQQ